MTIIANEVRVQMMIVDGLWNIYSGYLQINQSCNSAIFHHFVWNLSLTKHQGIDIDQITDRHKPCKNTVVKWEIQTTGKESSEFIHRISICYTSFKKEM